MSKYLQNYLEDIIEDHLDIWEEKYFRKSLEDIEFDLRTNYDFSCEIEKIERKLGRELSYDECQNFKEEFIQAIKRNFYKR